MSQRPSISSAQLCLRTSSCSWVSLFLEGWWQDLHSGHRKTLHSAKLKTHSIGVTPVPAALHSAAHQMMGLRQCLWDPHSLMIGGKPRGNLPGSVCGSVCWGDAEVSSTRRRFPWFNLRWSLWVGAWNVLSLREDDHLSLLSSELKRLSSGIAALS